MNLTSSYAVSPHVELSFTVSKFVYDILVVC